LQGVGYLMRISQLADENAELRVNDLDFVRIPDVGGHDVTTFEKVLFTAMRPMASVAPKTLTITPNLLWTCVPLPPAGGQKWKGSSTSR
jgi:hypothetical protein